MKFLRKLLQLDDHASIARASETEREIREKKAEYDSKLVEIEHRAQQQTFQIIQRRNDRVISDWGGAMEILRDRE